MSPLKIKKLSKIRSELDKLDNLLIKLIKKRTFLVKKVLLLKERKSQIVDKKRIKEILLNIKKKSQKNNYLLCGGSFFSTKISCFLVTGLYFFALSFTLAFSPPVGFLT